MAIQDLVIQAQQLQNSIVQYLQTAYLKQSASAYMNSSLDNLGRCIIYMQDAIEVESDGGIMQ